MSSSTGWGRWWEFIRERFPLRENVLVALANVGAYTVAARGLTTHGSVMVGGLDLVLAAAALLLFFRLRVFDEMKDFTVDRTAHPDRPLARGLISVAEAKAAAFSCLVFEGVCSAAVGSAGLAGWSVTAGYSLLMYREFFIGKWLRPMLATYAVMHTLIASLIAVWIFCAATGASITRIPATYVQLALANWGVFNLFEFGRKTFGMAEERRPDESYSKRFGPTRAAVHALLMAVSSSGLAVCAVRALNLSPLFMAGHGGLLGLLAWRAWQYTRAYDAMSARAFRAACGAYLLCYQLLLLVGILLSRGVRWNA